MAEIISNDEIREIEEYITEERIHLNIETFSHVKKLIASLREAKRQIGNTEPAEDENQLMMDIDETTYSFSFPVVGD